MTRLLLAAVAFVVLTSAAAAQIWLMANGGRAFGNLNAAPLTPCAAQQFDFSDATGCQLLSGIEILGL